MAVFAITEQSFRHFKSICVSFFIVYAIFFCYGGNAISSKGAIGWTKFVSWLKKSKIIGGQAGVVDGCVLGPIAIASSLMLMKRSMEMKKTIAHVLKEDHSPALGGGNGGSDDS